MTPASNIEDVTVLVVDDDPAIREALEILLESHDFPVRTFPSGIDLLSRCDMTSPVCLVLDIQMPEMSGFDLLRHLAGLGQRVPTVMMSSHADDDTKRKVLKAGAIGLLEKPFASDQLFEALATLRAQELH